MKLEKNVKENERRPIAQHLKYRERKGKKSKCVRVRGHEITQTKWTRWRKEHMSPPPLSSPPRTLCPPLRRCESRLLIVIALPSYVSILTGSPSGSPAMLPHTLLPNQQAQPGKISSMDWLNEVVQRLFAYSHDESVKLREAKPILNALQLILGCKRQKAPRKYLESWDAVTEEYITLFRNPINIAQKIAIHREWNSEWLHLSVALSTKERD